MRKDKDLFTVQQQYIVGHSGAILQVYCIKSPVHHFHILTCHVCESSLISMSGGGEESNCEKFPAFVRKAKHYHRSRQFYNFTIYDTTQSSTVKMAMVSQVCEIRIETFSLYNYKDLPKDFFT
jgi:hypothetical protein